MFNKIKKKRLPFMMFIKEHFIKNIEHRYALIVKEL